MLMIFQNLFGITYDKKKVKNHSTLDYLWVEGEIWQHKMTSGLRNTCRQKKTIFRLCYLDYNLQHSVKSGIFPNKNKITKNLATLGSFKGAFVGQF